MPRYTTQDIRNVALTGHGGSGKTMLVEAILQQTGKIGAKGSIERGDTVCDFDPLEKHHQHSLSSSIISCDYQDKHINLIDTPGFPDFMGHALSILPAVETMAVVINAHNGIEMMTRRMMAYGQERNLCRCIIVNKIDQDNVNLPMLIEQIRETFGNECLPFNLPCNNGASVIDVLTKAEGDSDFSNVHDAHTAIIDQIVEVDEKLMEKYLEDGDVSPKDLHAPFEEALREGHLVPIFFTSAHTGVGIDALLNFLTTLAPNPMEGNPRPFIKGEDENAVEFHAEPDESKHVIAHVFKVTVDPFVGRMGLFRIHQGRITKETQLYIGHNRKPVRVVHLFKLDGKDHAEVDAGIPGDICALAKIEELDFDCVLHDDPEDAVIHLKPLNFAKPMDGVAIEAKSRGDETKLAKAITSMTTEDPCLIIQRNNSTKQTVMYGLGQLHLRIVLEKMKERFHVEVDTKPPKIAYRETVIGKAQGHHRHKKQSGGAGQFGEVFLRIEPLAQGTGLEFENKTFGGSVPQQYIPAIEKGVRLVMEHGCIAGYPMQDIKVSVYDGKTHPVDSKEVAFVHAGKRAFMDAVTKAHPTLLEPVVDLEVNIPESHMGDIAGDLSGKRGHITGTDTIPGEMLCIRAQAPLAELTNYQSQVKAMTGGQGSYTMQLSHYEAVPHNIQQQIIAQYNPQEEED
ncbi:MAG: elongation factor G [Phycisphaeraceae bacterium]|nr:elongation factor G [Phycisphaeraceae bacterium]